MTFRNYIQRLSERRQLTTVSTPISKINEIEESTGAGGRHPLLENRAEQSMLKENCRKTNASAVV
jgi:3-polyprenyl-4-hydroxybenzoate decarboxylase